MLPDDKTVPFVGRHCPHQIIDNCTSLHYSQARATKEKDWPHTILHDRTEELHMERERITILTLGTHHKHERSNRNETVTRVVLLLSGL
jgi:hypothetical protein